MTPVILNLSEREADHTMKAKHCTCVTCVATKLAFAATENGRLRIEVTRP